ncbi:MAG: hypothetical protein J5855_08760 [Mailhella sp.]|nr:hypothetical protein [Mailhella sp.]
MSGVRYLQDKYELRHDGQPAGWFHVFTDGTASYAVSSRLPADAAKELGALGLAGDADGKAAMKLLSRLMEGMERVPGRKRVMYARGDTILEREPRETGERFSVYRRSAEKGEPDYSPLPHDAPHSEGPHTPEGMREWASWYAFNKMDDGTYQAELDEAWWWGGGHNDGGTIRRGIPEEWFELPYDEFLENVVRLAAAAHYGFTAEILKSREGLREFFGY